MMADSGHHLILSEECTYFRCNWVTLYTNNVWAQYTCTVSHILYTNILGVKCHSKMSCIHYTNVLRVKCQSNMSFYFDTLLPKHLYRVYLDCACTPRSQVIGVECHTISQSMYTLHILYMCIVAAAVGHRTLLMSSVLLRQFFFVVFTAADEARKNYNDADTKKKDMEREIAWVFVKTFKLLVFFISFSNLFHWSEMLKVSHINLLTSLQTSSVL